MLIQIRRVAILILCLMILLPSCVREVDLSTAYQKKVVVYCVIHTYGGEYWPSLVERWINKTYGVYSEYSPVQRLYMFYNSPNGTKEFIPQATVRLWNDETNEILAEFSRVSDDEWQAEYLPSYVQGTGGINEYDLHLRLEVTDIPGEDPIVAVTSFEKQINTKAWELHLDMGNYYIQKESVSSPVWILPEMIEYRVFPGPGRMDVSPKTEYVRHVPVRVLQSNYGYADLFNYSDDSFLYGVRISSTNRESDAHISVRVGDKRDAYYDDMGNEINYLSHFHLTYVSQEYDKYLRDAIVYRIRHDNESDPLKHLYEDQVYSNIEGGAGLFGAEVVIFKPVIQY